MSESDYRLVAENASDVIMRVAYDPDQDVLRAKYVSPSSFRVFGWHPEDMVGKGPEHFVAPEDLPTVIEAANRTLAGEQDVRVAFRMRRRDGSYVWVEHINRLARDPVTGQAGDFIIAMRDITERRRLEDQLVAMASTDGLTGLANRREFDRRLLGAWENARRENAPLSLLLIDLDNFKGFNDQYGHQVGDDCLRAVSRAVGRSVEGTDGVAARYGGEELAVVLPRACASAALRQAGIAREAVEALDIPHTCNPGGCNRVTISVGAATALSRDGGSLGMPQGLLSAADTALYKAKHNGRNRVETALTLAPAAAIGEARPVLGS